jgi:hypothetical protein
MEIAGDHSNDRRQDKAIPEHGNGGYEELERSYVLGPSGCRPGTAVGVEVYTGVDPKVDCVILGLKKRDGVRESQTTVVACVRLGFWVRTIGNLARDTAIRASNLHETSFSPFGRLPVIPERISQRSQNLCMLNT